MSSGALGDPIQRGAEFIRVSDHQIMAPIDDLGGPVGLALRGVVVRSKAWVIVHARQNIVLGTNTGPSQA